MASKLAAVQAAFRAGYKPEVRKVTRSGGKRKTQIISQEVIPEGFQKTLSDTEKARQKAEALESLQVERKEELSKGRRDAERLREIREAESLIRRGIGRPEIKKSDETKQQVIERSAGRTARKVSEALKGSIVDVELTEKRIPTKYEQRVAEAERFGVIIKKGQIVSQPDFIGKDYLEQANIYGTYRPPNPKIKFISAAAKSGRGQTFTTSQIVKDTGAYSAGLFLRPTIISEQTIKPETQRADNIKSDDRLKRLEEDIFRFKEKSAEATKKREETFNLLFPEVSITPPYKERITDANLAKQLFLPSKFITFGDKDVLGENIGFINIDFLKSKEEKPFITQVGQSIAEGFGSLPQQFFEIGAKTALTTRALLIPETTDLAKAEIKRTAKETPTTILKGIDEPFTKPEELANLIFLGTAFTGAKSIGETSPIKVRTTTISPEASITSLSIETGRGGAFIIGSKIKGRGTNKIDFFKGAPDVSDLLLKNLKGEIRISNPTETKIIDTSLKSAAKQAQVVSSERALGFIESAQSIIRKTQKTQSKFISSFLKDTERLSAKGVEIVLAEAKKANAFVSGSFSRSAQLAKEFKIKGEDFVLNKKPKDIDIHIEGSPEYIAKIRDITLGKLQAAGIKSRTRGEGGIIENVIEVKQPSGKYEKAVEFLGEGTIPISEVPPDFVVGFKKEGNKIFIDKQKTTTLAEELRGVTQGTARLRVTDNKLDIFPPEKRIKDIGSVSVSARTLEQSKFFKGSLLKDIEKFESLFPENLVREQVKRVTTSPDKTIFADFRNTKLDLSPSTTKLSGSSFAPSGTGIISVSLLSVPSSFRSNVLSPSRRVSEFKYKLEYSPRSSLSASSISISPQLQKPSAISTSGSRSRSSYPSVSISLSPSVSISQSPSISKSLSISQSPSISRSLSPSPSSSISKSPSSIISKIISSSSSITKPSPSPKSKSKIFSSQTIGQAFRTLLKTKGKFKEIGTGLSKGAALSLGAKAAATTLAATFKIQPTGKKTIIPQGDEQEFKRLKGLFRTYQIRGGKRIPLTDTFIQRRGKRLSSRSEISLIQKARKQAGGIRL